MSANSDAAERWFLNQGLPAVLQRDVRLRKIWSRSAPALAGLAAMAANSIIVVRVLGQPTIDIDSRPTLSEGVVLALLVVALPAAVLTGWLVSRLTSVSWRAVAVGVSLAVIAGAVVSGWPGHHPIVKLVLWVGSVLLILILTACGAGSILSWAARSTAANLGLVSGMFVRALPVVLLTFLVFFNTYVWLMAAIVSRTRLWSALLFLFAIAGAFLVTSTLDRVKPMLAAPGTVSEDQIRLAGTPFADMPAAPGGPPLSRSERVNVVFVVSASQLGQVMTAAITTGTIFFVFGLILVSPPLLDAWTRDAGSHDGQLLGMTLPVPDPLIQTTLLLTAITFMYLSAKAVSDREYRAEFVDPLIDELRLTLVARDRYRASLKGAQ